MDIVRCAKEIQFDLDRGDLEYGEVYEMNDGTLVMAVDPSFLDVGEDYVVVDVESGALIIPEGDAGFRFISTELQVSDPRWVG